MPTRLEIIPGTRYGKLTVVREDTPVVYQYPSGKIEQKRQVVCQCDCGKRASVLLDRLRRGNTTSCGCYHSEITILNNITHGLTNHPLYHIWLRMKQRCGNPNATQYYYYGNRGITVCDTWSNDFELFYNWATANGYQTGLQIDRIDNNLGYSPDNCWWATPKENSRNRSSNLNIEFDGRTACLADHCEALGLNYSTVRQRIQNYGWDINDALTTPMG